MCLFATEKDSLTSVESQIALTSHGWHEQAHSDLCLARYGWFSLSLLGKVWRVLGGFKLHNAVEDLSGYSFIKFFGLWTVFFVCEILHIWPFSASNMYLKETITCLSSLVEMLTAHRHLNNATGCHFEHVKYRSFKHKLQTMVLYLHL